jgi:hypothetical protein
VASASAGPYGSRLHSLRRRISTATAIKTRAATEAETSRHEIPPALATGAAAVPTNLVAGWVQVEIG